MSTVGTIGIVILTIGSSATLGLAAYNGWGAFGEFKQMNSSASSLTGCKPLVRSVAWSSSIGAQSSAHTKALIKWSDQTQRYGSAYSSWHYARRRQVTCKTLALYDAKCIVSAHPCQRVAEMTIKIDFDNLF